MAGVRILIVEDEIISAQAIASQLTRLGYEVIDIVASGSAAIDKVAETRPDLVLMDIMLKQPEIDGIEAAARIRSQFRIPVIYLTAHSEDVILARAKVTEPFGYIVKPFNQRDLRIGIEIALYKHRMEQQLIEREELLSTILDSTSDAVIATDEMGCITYMNPIAETLTGWTSVEALGKAIIEVVQIRDEATNAEIENPVIALLRGESCPPTGSHRILMTRQGTAIPILETVSLMGQETEQVKGAVVVLCDIRERRQADALELEKVKLSLAVSEREKAEQEVRHNQYQLNEFKSRIVSMISHDYRTPLAVILTSTGLLKRYGSQLTEEKKQTYLERIQAGVKQMDLLVEKVVTFNKVEANELRFNPDWIDVGQRCLQLVQEQRLLVGDRYTIDFLAPESPISAFLDHELLGHIITNLLENAIKYSTKGSTINLELKRQDPQISLTVKDSGLGIPQDEQAQIILPFFRASNVSTISGTGMGLSIVKKCVDLHGGQMAIASEIGIGTTVMVTLPIKLVE